MHEVPGSNPRRITFLQFRQRERIEKSHQIAAWNSVKCTTCCAGGAANPNMVSDGVGEGRGVVGVPFIAIEC